MIYLLEDDSIRNWSAIPYKTGLRLSVLKPQGFGGHYEKLRNYTLDVMLPEEDGISVLTKLRLMPPDRKNPGNNAYGQIQRIRQGKGLDRGADDYITKPFGVMELIARVKRC